MGKDYKDLNDWIEATEEYRPIDDIVIEPNIHTVHLKPCPLCGSKAELIRDSKIQFNETENKLIDRSLLWWIKCSSCQMSQWHFNSPEKAIKNWNSRDKL